MLVYVQRICLLREVIGTHELSQLGFFVVRITVEVSSESDERFCRLANSRLFLLFSCWFLSRRFQAISLQSIIRLLRINLLLPFLLLLFPFIQFKDIDS